MTTLLNEAVNTPLKRRRLAIVVSHPIQYYAPWFRVLAGELSWDIRVFYLWDFGVQATRDPEFSRSVSWDIDLLSGYAHEFVPSGVSRPGTDRFGGLWNPTLPPRLRAWAPDAVLLFGYGWATHTWLAVTWRRCPLILRGDSHLLGRGASTLRRRILDAGRRALLRRFSAFASVGVANRDFYRQQNVTPSKIFHVPHCVDNAAFAARARQTGDRRPDLGLPARPHLVVGFAGKFIAKKRPDILVRAFRRFAPPNCALLLLGEGPEEATLRQLAAGDSRIFFAPFQNQSAMPSALASLDLLVLPSEGPGETWGLIVNEAMAVGTPCIVSDHVGCRADLIIEGQTGWSCAAGDETALGAALSRALAVLSAEGGARFAEAARAKIAHYDYTSATTGLQALLDALPAKAA
jgi:glycosyltransferase involved in cell wall biosynthesis